MKADYPPLSTLFTAHREIGLPWQEKDRTGRRAPSPLASDHLSLCAVAAIEAKCGNLANLLLIFLFVHL